MGESDDALNRAIAQTTERQIAANIEQWCIFRPFWEEATEAASATADSARDEREIAA